MAEQASVFRAALEKLQRDQTFRSRDGFSISGIGNCAAQQLFGIAGFPKGNPPTGRQLLTWRAGNLYEVEIYFLIEQAAGYTVVGKQKEFIGAEPPREGHIDGLILRDGKLYTFDAKSANARSFDEWLRAAGISKWDVMREGVGRYDPREVPGQDYRPVKHQYESYYYQAQGYLELINSRPEYQVFRTDNMADVPPDLAAATVDGVVPIATDGFYFFVYCKDDSRLYEEYVPYDPEAIRARLDTLNEGYVEVKHAKQEGADNETLAGIIRDYQEVPLNADGKMHWKCQRCSFVEVCRK